MKIRSITYFFDPGWPSDEKALQQAGDFIAEARPAFQSAGYEVQTTRLASVPFPHLLSGSKAGDLIRLSTGLESAAQTLGFDYLSLGPGLPDTLESYSAIPAAMAATQSAFFSGLMTNPGGGISLPAVRACADIIHQAARLSADGFANLRFAALANVSPGCPFFPAAYHRGGTPCFALALEAADLAVAAFRQAGSLYEARQGLIIALEDHAQALSRVAQALEAPSLYFSGLDFSLAPFPTEDKSIGAALEALGLPALGLHGSLAVVAFLVDAIDRARFQRAGFNGFMPPILEDSILAQRAAEGVLTVKDLLLYAAVCGAGLDTMPLPGELTVDQLAAILLDVAALAQRLDKPLTARLMPVPGKRAGDPTDFTFGYFVNGRVMSVEAAPLTGLLATDETIALLPRFGHRG